MQIARRFEAEKNTAQAELKFLSRKFADLPDDPNGNTSNRKTKRCRIRHESLPADSDEETITASRTSADERFVFQAGHKYFLLCAPWLRTGDDLFDTDVDKHYDPAERFENDANKVQGQLKEVLDLVQDKFQEEALGQRWFRRQVSFIYNLQYYTYA